jgi:hypothetical protein
MEDFARAIGDNDSQILGVYPFSAIASGSGCDIIWHNDPLHTEGPTGGGTNGFRVSSGGSSGVAGSPFTNGTHLIELGVSGNWSNTRIGEPVFAAPQTYEVTLTATLVP